MADAIGKTVHFHRSSEDPPHAAMIVRILENGATNLFVFGLDGEDITEITTPRKGSELYVEGNPYWVEMQ